MPEQPELGASPDRPPIGTTATPACWPVSKKPFESRDQITKHIDSGIADGRYRDCLHLGTMEAAPEGPVGAPILIERIFWPRCDRQSFIQLPAYYVPPPAGFMQYPVPQCPRDCSFFEDRSAAGRRAQRAERRARWVARFRWPLKLIPGLVKWYGSAPWQTQVALALLLVLALAPQWAEPLAKVLRAALHGK